MNMNPFSKCPWDPIVLILIVGCAVLSFVTHPKQFIEAEAQDDD